jgi:hypothetical protein
VDHLVNSPTNLQYSPELVVFIVDVILNNIILKIIHHEVFNMLLTLIHENTQNYRNTASFHTYSSRRRLLMIDRVFRNGVNEHIRIAYILSVDPVKLRFERYIF